MRTTLIAVLSLIGASACGGCAAAPAAEGQDAATAAGGATLADARRAKVDAAKQMYEVLGRGDWLGDNGRRLESRYLWSRRWIEAERDAATDDAGRVAAVRAHLDRMKPLAEDLARLFESGRANHLDVVAARFYAAEAELWHAEAAGR